MRHQTIRTRLSIGYSILILLVLISISFAISLIFSNYLKESSLRDVESRISNIEESLQNELFSVIKLCDEIKHDPVITMALDSLNVKTSNYDRLIDIHNQTTSSNYIISRLVLINRNLEILDPIYSRYLYSEAILNDPDFIEFLSKDYNYYFSRPGTFPIDLNLPDQQDNLTVVLYQRLLDANYWLMGYLIAILRKDTLFNAVWENNQDNFFDGIAVFNGKDEQIYQEGLFFSAKDLEIDFSRINEEKSLIIMGGNNNLPSGKYMAFIKPIDGVNWYITGLVSYKTILKDREILLKTIFLLGLFFILFSMLVSYFIARTITKPLFSITAAMHSYDGNKGLKVIDIHPGGELGYFVDMYNNLVKSINLYIQNIYEEQEKKKEAELKSLQYELDYLQAQINPHFIHNTLNALGYQAEKAGNKELFESLKAFNTLLRAVLSGMDEFIPLKQELVLIENFIKILKLRYGNTFDLEVGICEKHKTCLVPKLLLQPLVENSLFHGIEPLSGRRGLISISSEISNQDLLLYIKDNGVGMERNKSEDLSRNQRHFNRIGIHNVDERIKILFGPFYGLSIETKKGEGTCIQLKIPYNLEQ